jgi:diguanylate cyclase (GGDEF)-like protein/PAS domain S-box-containing protein
MADKNLRKRPLILIADDDNLVRNTFQATLSENGYLTETASDGLSAVNNFRESQPDLIILDFFMPEKDGIEACQEIRGFPEGKIVPILMITGMNDTDLIHRAFEAGATDFIIKPFKPALLIYRIQYMLRASQSIKSLAQSEERLESAQRIARLGNWELDPASGMFWGSDEMLRILGLAEGNPNFSFESFLFTIDPSDRHLVASSLAKAFKHKSVCSLEFRVRHGNSSVHVVRLQGHADLDVKGDMPRFLGTIQEITEIRQVEDSLRMLKEAIDCLPIGITLSDAAGKIIYSNPAEAEIHGYSREELVGKEASIFAPSSQKKPLTTEQLNNMGLLKRESINVRKDGEAFPVQLTSLAVRSIDGRCLGIVTTCEDITGRKETEKKIHRLAYYDPLTGLPNRGMFLDRLHQALAFAHREERNVCLVFLDLDNFKDVNDTYGHDFGDKLLKQVAERLNDTMRESDTLARLGGDEFVVILTSITSHESTANAAQRILGTFNQPFLIDDKKIFCSVSIGIAVYPDDGMDTESLLKCADTAMYHAKEEGKSQYRFFSSEMNQKIMRRVLLENSLRQGLDREEFFVKYQPQWDLKTSRMMGVEVLLRWQSLDFGLLPPSEFIALTENSGLIFELGQWVLRTACKQSREWEMAGYHDFKVAVNISGKQLRQPDFLEMISNVVKETGVTPQCLELEFTESVIMEDAEKTIDTLRLLKKLGVQLSIDNFGTGYSSLNYLKHFPIDRIKIDRSFIADLDSGKSDAALVEAIISMGHSLHRKVLAEGVEHESQLEYLTELGCDEVQGFYLALPMNAEDLTARLMEGNGNYLIKHELG